MRYLATLEGVEHELEVEELDANRRLIRLGEQQFEVDLRRVGPASFSAIVNGRSFDFEVHRDAEQVLVVSRDGTTRVNLIDRARRAAAKAGAERQLSGPAQVKAAMPGRVVNVLVKVGDQVEAGQGVLIVEAMKMENELKAPKAGKVIEVKVAAGQTVERGDLLLVIE
jgi:biotin carboxyl carrier protein